ncbi:hypothetical protein AB1207_07435 [Kineococcus endophyticus]|uniref:Uncharacterized protein n=1 Tax=Kineococcus endophyticus TaxID=1181883 RepID=A0ABV3P4N0_9ACTN
MSHEADTVAERPTGAQTVAPVQASALLFAASILGEGSYTPEQELKGTLNAAGRVEAHTPAPVEPVVEQVVEPVVEQVVAPVPAPQPVAQPAPTPAPAAAPAPVERKGFFARLIDKLLGRG